MTVVKEPHELALMRQAGHRLADVVSMLRDAVRAGMSTAELDELAEAMIRRLGAVPSFKGYSISGEPPYPASTCISINEQVVHGIPGGRVIRDGDVVSIDVGLIFGGYHSDRAFTVAVGEASPEVLRLLDVAEQSLYEGIAQAVAGNRIGDVGHAVQDLVEAHGFGVVREYVGHGIGRALHETPSIPNYGRPHKGQLLRAGMCVAIEPMVTMGHHATRVLPDQWTVVTRDGSVAAHFEHTVVITATGPEILTRNPALA